jgi:hypothetical protein
MGRHRGYFGKTNTEGVALLLDNPHKKWKHLRRKIHGEIYSQKVTKF